MARSHGFRLSSGDAGVLLLGAALTWLLWAPARDLAVGVAVALGHFFLFCNVFRVRRRLELIWAGLLVLNVGAFQVAGAFSWSRALMVQAPVTLTVLILTVRSPDYVGIGSRPRTGATGS